MWSWGADAFVRSWARQITLWSFVIVFYAFEVPTLGSGEGFRALIGLLVLFGPAMSGFCYIMSYLFDQASWAVAIVIIVDIVAGLILGGWVPRAGGDVVSLQLLDPTRMLFPTSHSVCILGSGF
jgi:hypothetical protein